MKIRVETRVAQPPEQVFPVFGDEAFVESLAPWFMGVDVRRIGLALGDEIEVRFTRLGPRGAWVSRIVEATHDTDGITFVDESVELPWPFVTFRHFHGILADGTGALLVDELSFGVSPVILEPIVGGFLRWSFRARGRAYRRRFGIQADRV